MQIILCLILCSLKMFVDVRTHKSVIIQRTLNVEARKVLFFVNVIMTCFYRSR